MNLARCGEFHRFVLASERAASLLAGKSVFIPWLTDEIPKTCSNSAYPAAGCLPPIQQGHNPLAVALVSCGLFKVATESVFRSSLQAVARTSVLPPAM